MESLDEILVNESYQWIYVRSRNEDNPVLLFLHGGPGSPMMPLARLFGSKLEEHFTVVHWDQRASGKSRSRPHNPEDLTIRKYRDDTLAVVNYLRKRFDQNKIYLVGHSWGSVLGVYAVRDHPELFYAYIGIGQTVNPAEGEQISLKAVMQLARNANNQEALAELETLSPPYSKDPHQILIQRKWLSHFVETTHEYPMNLFVQHLESSPEYSPRDVEQYWVGSAELGLLTWSELTSVDFLVEAPKLDLPVYFFAGRHDHQVPSELVEKYFERLAAPSKELIWFEESAHMIQLTEPERYQDVLINKVLEKSDKD